MNTIWLEILVGKYFGRLLKLWHLAEFTLVVEQVLAIMIFIAKWLIAGNLTLGSWTSFNCTIQRRRREQAVEIFLGKWPTMIAASVSRVDDHVHVVCIAILALASQLFSYLQCSKLCLHTQLSMVNSMPTITLSRAQLQAYCTHRSYN